MQTKITDFSDDTTDHVGVTESGEKIGVPEATPPAFEEKKEMGETERMFFSNSFEGGSEEKKETGQSPSDFPDFDFEQLLWSGNHAGLPVVNYGDDYVVTEGESLEAGKTYATPEEIIEAIRTVEDPEIMINIYDLGLIYRMDTLVNGDVEIDMTVTAPSCPVAGVMPKQVAQAVSKLENTGKVTVKLLWEPAWTPDRMSENAKYVLDMF